MPANDPDTAVLSSIKNLRGAEFDKRMAPADRLRLSMVWLALAGLAADWAGLHFMVGAFLAYFYEW